MISLYKNSDNHISISTRNSIFHFSYDTLVAFSHKGELYICENIWSKTTGKHLNEICSDKKIRMTYEDFLNKYNELIGD